MQRLLLTAAAILALAGCAAVPHPANPGETVAEEQLWRALATADDTKRLTGLPDEMRSLLASVPSRMRGPILREGDLLSPDSARDHPAPPPGSYRCRLTKLTAAAKAGAGGQIRSFPDFFCYIRGERNNELSFTKQTGTELPRGWLYKDGDRRLVLIGARQREGGDNSLAYGAEPDRDVVGILERVGPFRWRVMIADRAAAQGLDIYELTPVPLKQQAEEPRPTSPVAEPSTGTATGVNKASRSTS